MTTQPTFPALAVDAACSGNPGVLEFRGVIADTGQMHAEGELTPVFWKEELITREQALQALTINGAYQMHVENERGSIKVGKYADFVLADKDVLTCPAAEIHNTNVAATYFEGKQVYPY